MTTPVQTADLRPHTDSAPVGSQQQYERFLPIAAEIPEARIRPLRADVSLAIVNARSGADAVLTRADEIRSALPLVSIQAIEGISDLGLALAFAAGRIERYAASPSDTRKLLSRIYPLRALLLGAADTLALAGIFSSAAVKKIREGRGAIDAAGDCVALAALYREHAEAIRGKVPFTGAEVDEAAEVGSRLLLLLRPEAAVRKPTDQELKDATVIRDRLWTLFERTWEDQVWRSGAWLFGREVDEHVPSLQSRVASKRPSAASTETTAPPTECPSPES